MKYILTLVILIGFTSFTFAQDYGYCNGGNLVEAMAKKEKTDEQLTAFQAPLIKEGQDKVLAIKEKEKKLYQEIETGVLSQKAIQERQEVLYAEAKTIEAFEKEVADKIGAKRQELLSPLLEKVQSAIDEVAKSKGFKMVFDESVISAVLYGDSALDITPEVKAKLGI